MKGKEPMTNGEMDGYMEAVKIIAEMAADTETVIKAIERIQEKLEK